VSARCQLVLKNVNFDAKTRINTLMTSYDLRCDLIHLQSNRAIPIFRFYSPGTRSSCLLEEFVGLLKN